MRTLLPGRRVNPRKTPLITHLFQDQKIGEVTFADKPDSELVEDWRPGRDAAVACGAFPFAFRVKDLVRAMQDFTGSPHLVNWPQSPRNFPTPMANSSRMNRWVWRRTSLIRSMGT